MCNLCVFLCTASLLLPPWCFWILLFQGCHIGCFLLITVLCECIRNWCSVYTRFDISELAVWPTEWWKILWSWVGEAFFLFFFFPLGRRFIFWKWCLINSMLNSPPPPPLLPSCWRSHTGRKRALIHLFIPPTPPLFTVLVYSSWHFNLKGPHGVPIIGEIVHVIHWHVSEIFMRCSVVSQPVL